MSSFSDCLVVSLGDLVADVVVAIPALPVEADRDQLVQKIQLEPGGAGNFLIAGSRLGMRMVALGAIGDDLYGRETLRVLRSEGIDIRMVDCQAEGTTTTVFALTDENGKHVYLGQYGSGPLVPLSVQWKQALSIADAVMTYGYTLNEPRLVDTMLAGMEYARAQGKLVVFDPGPQAATAAPGLCEQAVKRASALLLTGDEVQSITGDADPESVRGLLSDTLRLVCVKFGEQGCVIHTASERVEHPGYRVELRDTSAAGDSFAAAFIGTYLRGRPLAEVAAIANAMGAAKVRKLGSGRSVPTLEEVRAVLQQAGAGIQL